MPRKNSKTTGPASVEQHIAEQLRPLAVGVDQVHLDPKNTKEHGSESVAAIAASLRNFGQVKPIVANRTTREIEAGNGTYLAALSLGWTVIAVVWVDHDPTQKRGFAIADNRSAEFARWNQAVLDELLLEVKAESGDLYTDLQLADLEQPPAAPVPTDAASPSPRPPEKQHTYQVVVECSDPQDRQRLMRGLKKQGRRCRALTWDGVVASPGEALSAAQ